MDETAINRWFWIVISISIVLLLAIGGGFFYLYNKYNTLKFELVTTQEEVAKQNKELLELQKRQREINENVEVSKMYEAFLPSTEDIPLMFEEISKKAVMKNLLVDYAAVSIPSQQTAGRGQQKELYETRVFSFNLVGRYTDLVAFINEVERLDRFVMINKVSISGTASRSRAPKDQWVDPTLSPYLGCTVLIYTFVYTGG